MSKGRVRNRKKSFWVTDCEAKRIDRIAVRTGMRLGEFLCFSVGKTIYQVEELKPILHELKGISRNLNQLTMLSHAGQIKTVNLQSAGEALDRNYRAINGLYNECSGAIASGNSQTESGETKRGIENMLNAIQNGIYTESTQERLT